MKRLPVLPAMPSMQCDADCRACCTVIPLPEADYQRIRRIVAERGITLRVDLEHPDQCPLFTADGRCAIYDDRPPICRAYGHIPEMRCERGYSAPSAMLSESDAARVGDHIRSRGVATRLLHELVLEKDPAAPVDLESLWDFAPPEHRARIPARRNKK